MDIEDLHDAEVVHEYGRQQADFGGTYVRGAALVAMFTGNLDHHASELRSRLRRPDRLRVEITDRPYAEVKAAARRVQRRLLLESRPIPEVVGVGIAIDNGKFVIDVKTESLTDTLAAVIRDAAAPDEVMIRPGLRMVR